MEEVTVVLTDEQIQDLDFMSAFYGEKNKAKLLKLALRKFVRIYFAPDREEWGQDIDLEKILGE